MLAVETIKFRHGNQANHQPAVRQNVSFVVQEPRIVVLLDLSGAGKSTLICCLNGALVPQGGGFFLVSPPGPSALASTLASVPSVHCPLEGQPTSADVI